MSGELSGTLRAIMSRTRSSSLRTSPVLNRTSCSRISHGQTRSKSPYSRTTGSLPSRNSRASNLSSGAPNRDRTSASDRRPRSTLEMNLSGYFESRTRADYKATTLQHPALHPVILSFPTSNSRHHVARRPIKSVCEQARSLALRLSAARPHGERQSADADGVRL